jgi:hypothetical protein
VYLANADGSDARHINTGRPFNFVPQWSPDGSEVLFLSGEHYDCHPHVVRSDGTGLRKLADRNGYKGVIDFLDVPDFHGGSSDVPVWSADGRSVFYTAQVGRNVELFRVTRDGKSERLTDTPAGSLHYHPQPSRDGKWLVYGSKRDGVRNLYLLRLDGKREKRLTDLTAGWAAMWPHWQPRRLNLDPGQPGNRRDVKSRSCSMLKEAKVVCRFCRHEFWAGLEGSAPCDSNQLFEVECPWNGSPFLFRLAQESQSGWDGNWIYLATEWRPIDRLGTGQPLAVCTARENE